MAAVRRELFFPLPVGLPSRVGALVLQSGIWEGKGGGAGVNGSGDNIQHLLFCFLHFLPFLPKANILIFLTRTLGLSRF